MTNNKSKSEELKNTNLDIKKEPKNKKMKSKLRENIELVLWAIVIALLIRIFIVEAYRIPSQSLYPNFIENDHLLVNKLVYGVRLPLINVKLPAFTQPKRGEIVIFQNPKYISPGLHLEFFDLITFSVFGIDQDPVKNPKNFIKRCMALPGDTIEWLEEKRIKINGKLLPLEYKELFDYSKVDWGKQAHTKKVDLYEEKNGEKTYSVQYLPSTNNISNPFNKVPKLYYMPQEGDILQIKRKHPASKTLIYTIKQKVKNNESDNTENISEEPKIIDITHLWNPETIGNAKIVGYIKIFTEESNMDLSQTELLKRTKDDKTFEYEIKHNYYFMIGDNRDNSEDGRFFGPTKESLILGAPLIRYFPFNRFGGV